MTVCFVDPDRIDGVAKALNNDAELQLATRMMSADVLLQADSERCLVSIRNGDVTLAIANAGELRSDTYIRGTAEIWTEMLRAEPAAGYSDFPPAMAWYGLELGGDITLLHIYRQAFSRLLTCLRESQSGSTKPFEPRELPSEGTFEAIVGRYVYVTVAGVSYRVYFEEAGNPDGIPLICQHTAGADCRQWRYLLNDPVVAEHYRIIAADLPFHGKSLPPEGTEWWKTLYRLDEELALGLPVALSRVLGLTRPVYIGVSIGGMMASDLPWKHPGVFRAVLACEAGEFMGGWDDPLLGDPRTRNRTSMMTDCQSPLVPVQNLHENSFVNDGAAYSILAGDVHYYSQVHDLRDKLDRFDTTTTAVYIMNGEYDLATPPSVGDDLAAKIKGAKSIALMGLGHFPHCEDYELFKTYLHPVLDEIRGS